MTRIAWCTDIHLNFLTPDEMFSFVEDIKVHRPDALFITGDIAEAPNVWTYLDTMDSMLRVPIYFVLGNHDYYNGSIEEVRKTARDFTNDDLNGLAWMPARGVVELSKTTAVVGVDGWGDGRFGNPDSSPIFLNDWLSIRELLHKNPMSKDTHRKQRIPALNKLGDEEAETLRAPLDEALGQYEKVFVLTHVPPWDVATWHMGEHSDPDWQPWFSCMAVGKVIEEISEKHPGKQVVVLCGHTHGDGTSQITEDIIAITGGARYRYPKVDRVFEILDQ